VEIANRLEATGKPGFVHVSGRTLSNLNVADYTIHPGTEMAQMDPVLQKHPMSTFLLSAVVNRASDRPVDVRPSYVDLDIKNLEPTRDTASLASMTDELREEFNKMPVGGLK